MKIGKQDLCRIPGEQRIEFGQCGDVFGRWKSHDAYLHRKKYFIAFAITQYKGIEVHELETFILEVNNRMW